MQAPILIVTPTAGFGELIQQTLEMAGYQPALVRDPDRALELARQTAFLLAILDSDLEGASLLQLSEALRQILPGLILIGTLPDEGGDASPDFTPDATLNKPFYLPDLLEMVQKLLPAASAAAPASRESLATGQEPASGGMEGKENEAQPPPWLEDAANAARRLTLLSPAQAQAALITREGRLWAYNGQFSPEAVEELAQIAMQSWVQGSSQIDSRSDLARFVRLRAVEGDFMLYATHLAAGLALVLVFDAETPFSKIRAQAGKLARALASPPGDEETLITEPVAATSPEESAEARAAAPEPSFLPPDLVPPPSPGRQPRPGRPAPAAAVQEPPREERTIDLDEMETVPSFAVFEDEPETSLAVAFPADLQTGQPGSIEEITRSIDLLQPMEYQQLPSGLYLLSYACVLVPRLPQHHLTGNLPMRLSDWVRQLSLSFGWRLETLAIRPDYLLWINQVTPNTSPGYVVKVMRRHTSQHIFDEFPHLAQDNPSGDFWATGYLAITTSQPPPAQVLKDFVAHTRRRQGASGRR